MKQTVSQAEDSGSVDALMRGKSGVVDRLFQLSKEAQVMADLVASVLGPKSPPFPFPGSAMSQTDLLANGVPPPDFYSPEPFKCCVSPRWFGLEIPSLPSEITDCSAPSDSMRALLAIKA